MMAELLALKAQLEGKSANVPPVEPAQSQQTEADEVNSDAEA